MWDKKQIGEIIINIADGGTPSRNQKENFGGNHCWIVIDDIKDEIYDTREKLTDLGLARCSSYYWEPDTVILSTGATIGEVGITKVKAATKQGISGIVVDRSKIIPEYLKYFFQLNKGLVKSLAQGSTIKEVRPPVIRKIQINLPSSVIEQIHIAQILSKADAAIAQTEALIAKYQRIKTGLMQDLLTKGIDEHGNIRSEQTHRFKTEKGLRVPEEWEVTLFGQTIELVHGYQFRNFDFTIHGLPIVKISQVTPEGLDMSNCSYINESRLSEFEKQRIKNGDVLMALTGATLGKACLVQDLIGEALQNYRVGLFEPLYENDVDKTYLYYVLTTKEFLNQIFNKVNAGAQGNIGKADFEKALFVKPPFKEQLKISEILLKITKLIEGEVQKRDKAYKLKTGLMQDLLSGRVRVKIKENANTTA